jgi:agmatine deiminase
MNRFVPHEFAQQAAIHTLWPSQAVLWPECLTQARIEFARFLELAAEPSAQDHATEIVIYASTDEAETDARQRCAGFARFERARYGDVWARDTGPVFVNTDAGLRAVRFQFNGWGGKYVYEGDTETGIDIASRDQVLVETSKIVCEGGALEFDGAGTLLTTRDSVLNPNRNPGLSETEFEVEVERLFGVTRVIWLDRGLIGDHTDGHIDNIARFIAPGRVVCQRASGDDDPNAEILAEIEAALRDANLDVVTIASPGHVSLEDDEIAAASHMNWVVGAKNLVMPIYNDRGAEAARDLQSVLKSHEVVTSPSRAILLGGGSFHCVTCNQPT